MMGTTERSNVATSAPSTAVVEAVATAEGRDPGDVPEPLYESVDTDALEAMIASMDEGQVTFTYHGYEVAVDADGDVTLSQ